MKSLIKRYLPESIRTGLHTGKEKLVSRYYDTLARQLLSANSEEDTGFAYILAAKEFTTDLAIYGYMQGMFPTSLYGDGVISWFDPDPRAKYPLDGSFNVPKNVARLLRQDKLELRIDQHFADVMRACGENREKTQINADHIAVYTELHRLGVAHCVSAWQDGELVGGSYGVGIGGYFALESGFYRIRDAGKVTLVRLVEILMGSGYQLMDIWWPADHMEQFNGQAISREQFHQEHVRAIIADAHFNPDVPRTLSTGYADGKPPQQKKKKQELVTQETDAVASTGS